MRKQLAKDGHRLSGVQSGGEGTAVEELPSQSFGVNHTALAWAPVLALNSSGSLSQSRFLSVGEH